MTEAQPDKAAAEAKSLLDVLHAWKGIICITGAGGKKSTIRCLAEAWRSCASGRLLLTSTVQIAKRAYDNGFHHLIAEPADLLDRARHGPGKTNASIFAAAPSIKPGRFAGLPPDIIAPLHRKLGATLTLVKADGARMRMIKAPADEEPVLPPCPDTVLPLVSARALGRPLTSAIAHRPERLATLVGATIGEPITPYHMARLISHPKGGLKDAGDATIVPIINMVDDGSHLDGAIEAARLALAMSDRFDRVLLATMAAAAPLMTVISRG